MTVSAKPAGNVRLAPIEKNVFVVGPQEEKTLSDEQRQLLDLISWRVDSVLLNPNVENAHRAEILAELDALVIGQDEAKSKLVDAIMANVYPIRKKEGPLGVFFFMGPTWVGKTELAKALAQIFLGNRESLTKIACENYQDWLSASNLFGSSKSYVGYGEPTPLNDTQLFRHYKEAKERGKLHRSIAPLQNFSVLLFDEIEKAHPKIHQSLLGILNDGKLTFTSGKENGSTTTVGREVVEHSTVTDFSNTIIIMTSNVGSRQVSKDAGPGMGFVQQESSNASDAQVYKKAIERMFSPEFIGRIHSFIPFHPLSMDDCRSILKREIDDYNWHLREFMSSGGVQIELTGAMEGQILKMGYSKEKGARELVRTFQSSIEASIDRKILSGAFDKIPENVGIKIQIDWAIQPKKDEGEPDTYGTVWKTVIDPNFVPRYNDGTEEDDEEERLSAGNVRESLLREYALPVIVKCREYATLYAGREETNVDFEDELKALSNELLSMGMTQKDLLILKTGAQDEIIRDLDFIDTFEWLFQTQVFHPIPMAAIKKIIRHYIQPLKARWIMLGAHTDETIHIRSAIEREIEHLVGKPLNRAQMIEMVALIHHSIVH